MLHWYSREILEPGRQPLFLALLAFLVTFLVTREGTSRAYREIGISDGHHPLTHHMNKPDLMEKVAQINTYHTTQVSAWLQRLKASTDRNWSIVVSINKKLKKDGRMGGCSFPTKILLD